MLSLFSNHGILGLNARSLLYIKPFNPKKVTALADSKLKTKSYLAARGIPVAKLYGRVETREQARTFDFSQLPDECVLKPNHGYGGEGIIILRGRDKKGRFLRNGKRPMDDMELREHLEDILDGKFSLKGLPDSGFFEQILTTHECFARFRPVGLPDLRIIVFNLVPVMAMLRIPTADSDGKANIHLGGIGIGIDMAKGTTTYGAQYRDMIKELPHGGPVAGHKIPFWDDILLVCSRIQQITNIGYLACDITIDQHQGPMLLEVNARAGLMVQVANLAPLRSRLERVQGIKVDSPEKGVRIGQDLFGRKAKSAPAKSTTEQGKPTLGLHETIKVTVADGSAVEVPSRIASDAERTIFDTKLLNELLEKDGAEPAEDTKNGYKVKFALAGKKLQTVVTVADLEGEDLAVIGTRDLAGFLIDPSKKTVEAKQKTTTKKVDLRALDKQLGQLDRDLLLLKYIKPINLGEEMERMQADPLYNPTFSYPEVPLELPDIEKKLDERIEDDSPLGKLLNKKRIELIQRINLLKARGDAEKFTEASITLFGRPSAELLAQAKEDFAARAACELSEQPDKNIDAEEAAERFNTVLEKYGLHNWQASVRQKLVADVTVGGNSVYIRADAKFSEEAIASLIAHEIETHVITSENGSHQPYLLLRRGCAQYLDTQEGLAIYNQNQVLSTHAEKRFNPPRNLIGLEFSLTHSLAQTRTFLESEMGYHPQKAITQAITMKRGLCDTSEPGGFTKSIVYYRGLKAIEQFVADGGDLKRLYIGKVTLADLPIIEELPNLQTPLILPSWLREDK